MTCETCGEKKPKNDSPSFTKATVEILNPKELSMFRKVVVPASMGDDTTNPPKVGKYCNVLLYYEANEQAYLYSSDGIPTKLTGDLTLIKKQIKDLQDEDVKIWDEIELIEMSSDVVDIVGTYAELQQYDTSKLHNNDIIKVLQDETHDDKIAYYRWSTSTSAFSYVGSEGPYYTESEVDVLLSGKQDTLIAGTNIQIAADGKTISATDTTYTHFTGATASTDGVQGLVPGPLAGDEGKFLSGDGTWQNVQGASYTAGNGINISAQDEISIDTTVVAELSDLPGVMTGATSGTAGTSGLVPAPSAGDQAKVLKGDGTWGDVQPGMTTYFLANSLEDYASSSNIFSIYKDASLTTAVTSLEFNEVATGGPVQLVHSNPTSTEYYRVGFAYDNTDSYQMYDEMSYDIYDLRTYTIYSIEDLGNGSFKMQGLGKQELQQKLTAGTNITINGATISATDTTYSAFGGATSSVAGSAGLVPAPTTSDPDKYLKGDGTWSNLPSANNISSNDWSTLWQ